LQRSIATIGIDTDKRKPAALRTAFPFAKPGFARTVHLSPVYRQADLRTVHPRTRKSESRCAAFLFFNVPYGGEMDGRTHRQRTTAKVRIEVL
jgi:hypothetical protein